MPYLPCVPGVLSDAAKLEWVKTWDQIGNAVLMDGKVAQLAYRSVLVENFDDLLAWTEVDSGGNVNLAGNVVSMNGNAVNNANGIWRTVGFNRVEGVLQFDVMWDQAQSISDRLGMSTVAGLQETGTGNIIRKDNGAIGLSVVQNTGTNGVSRYGGLTAVGNVWYTLRIYLSCDRDVGQVCSSIFTIQGGAFTAERIIARISQGYGWLASPWYPMFQRITNNAACLTNIRLLRWNAGFWMDGPSVLFPHDAGAGQVFTGLDFTNFAMPPGITSTNLTFAFSFDDGVPVFSPEFTLANLKLQGAQPGAHRFINLRVTLNSDGITQQLAAKPDAADAISGVWGAGMGRPVRHEVLGHGLRFQ